MSDVQLPRWAANARDVFRALWVVYIFMWLIRGALALVDLLLDIDLYFSPRWLDLTVYTMAGIWLASGLVWLAGGMVAGYREPNAK